MKGIIMFKKNIENKVETDITPLLEAHEKNARKKFIKRTAIMAAIGVSVLVGGLVADKKLMNEDPNEED
ncbi:membrane [Arthrobacter phage Qui]|uniref:Membrane n=1 Tax=Arthrobacter phage Qui TaxID=2603260 RepID=A0A5B8WFU9_9CAUD|nr:membrane [Arthrobacter phage Qui]QED11554.1 membrane [Arthrobacter phage Qui]